MTPLFTCGSFHRVIHFSVVTDHGASDEGSQSFALPIFALPWVRLWLPFPLGVSSQLHTPPLPATHVGLATGLHTSRDSITKITQRMRLQVARRVGTACHHAIPP